MINSLAKTGYWFGPTLTPNGTAVVIVCVIWRNPPVDSPGCEQGKSPGGLARYGVVFAKSCAAGYAIAVE
jgi:hypothetical protein